MILESVQMKYIHVYTVGLLLASLEPGCVIYILTFNSLAKQADRSASFLGRWAELRQALQVAGIRWLKRKEQKNKNKCNISQLTLYTSY